MIIHDVLQGTTEWLALRAGIPTASQFDRIITPKTGKPSTAADTYLYELLAERILRRPLDRAITVPMEQGSLTEAEAVGYYCAMRDVDAVPCGFVTNDARTWGASPDRLVGDEGLLEIKCHLAGSGLAKHMRYLLTGELDADHKPQLQGQLWVGERDWVEFVSYSPGLPTFTKRVHRDADFIALLSGLVQAFSDRLEAAALDCRERGWIRDTDVEQVEIFGANPQ